MSVPIYKKNNMNNIFVNNDPLLTQNEYSQRMEQLRQMQDELERSRRQMTAPARTATPLWDEITREMDGMEEQEVEYMKADEDFVQSERHIMGIMQSEYLKMMRPLVEGTKEGHDALEAHLQIVKGARRRARREANKDMEQWKEYTEKYSNMTYQQYKEMKGGTK